MQAVNGIILIYGLIFNNYFQKSTLNLLIISTVVDLFCSNFLYNWGEQDITQLYETY